MQDYIMTYTGIRFYPADPDPEGICIEDIAHALSVLCRGNGHVATFWSVAQHCIICAREAAARGLPDRIVLACLLHDASECYLSDVPRPFKDKLAGYREHEERLLQMIYTRYLGSPLSGEERKVIKEIDDGALYYDLQKLLHNEQSEQNPYFQVVPDYQVRPFEEVEQEYLELFRIYYGRLHQADSGLLRTRAPERRKPDYALMAAQLEAFAETEPSMVPLLSNASALLMDALADVNWAGFYLRRENGEGQPELLLGPFQGKTACIVIPWGKGVCGTAAAQDRTQLVPDVHAFPGHIACDSASNAEIVVPLHDRDGRVAGVLDIDSPLKGRFTEEDREGLEMFAQVLEKRGEL